MAPGGGAKKAPGELTHTMKALGVTALPAPKTLIPRS